jgi:hypothetical protein
VGWVPVNSGTKWRKLSSFEVSSSAADCQWFQGQSGGDQNVLCTFACAQIKESNVLRGVTGMAAEV